MAGCNRSFFMRNGIMLVVILMLVLVSVVDATTIKIGYDGSDTYFTVPTSATKAESGSMYFDTGTNRLKVYDGGWVDIYADGGGAGGNVFDQDLNSTDAPTFATLNTGQGAYELYAMNQDVLTGSSVTFDDITLTSYGNLDKDSTDDISLDTCNDTFSHNDTFIKNSNGNYYTATGANLETAIADAGDNGWVKCPSGKISITGDVDINGLTNFSLIGDETELEVSDSSSFNDGGVITVLNCEKITIQGLEIDGNHPYNTSSAKAYAGINIRSMNNSVISDCEIHHVLGDGIVLQDATEATWYDENSCNNTIKDNYIHHIGEVQDTTSSGDAGIRIMGASYICNNTIENNRIDMIREHGIKIYGYGIIGGTYRYIHCNNKILNNYISNVNQGNWDESDNVYGMGIYAGGTNTLVDGNTVFMNRLMEHGISATDYCIINNNDITFVDDMNTGFYGIYCQVTVNTNDKVSVIVTNNIINGNDKSLTRGIAIVGSVTYGYFENATVKNNQISNVSGIGIYGQYVNNSIISYNHIFNTGSDAINLEGNYNSVTHNNIRESGDEGIGLTNINYCDITNNKILFSTGRGIDVYGTCTWCKLNDNIIIQYASYGIEFKTSSTFDFFDISGNFFVDDGYGIIMDAVENSTICRNIFDVNSKPIWEYSDCNYNLFIGNNAQASGQSWDMNGANQQNTTNIPSM